MISAPRWMSRLRSSARLPMSAFRQAFKFRFLAQSRRPQRLLVGSLVRLVYNNPNCSASIMLKNYDRWNYPPEKRAAIVEWDRDVRGLLTRRKNGKGVDRHAIVRRLLGPNVMPIHTQSHVAANIGRSLRRRVSGCEARGPQVGRRAHRCSRPRLPHDGPKRYAPGTAHDGLPKRAERCADHLGGMVVVAAALTRKADRVQGSAAH